MRERSATSKKLQKAQGANHVKAGPGPVICLQVPVCGVGRPSVSRGFNQLHETASLSRQKVASSGRHMARCYLPSQSLRKFDLLAFIMKRLNLFRHYTRREVLNFRVGS